MHGQDHQHPSNRYSLHHRWMDWMIFSFFYQIFLSIFFSDFVHHHHLIQKHWTSFIIIIINIIIIHTFISFSLHRGILTTIDKQHYHVQNLLIYIFFSSTSSSSLINLAISFSSIHRCFIWHSNDKKIIIIDLISFFLNLFFQWFN